MRLGDLDALKEEFKKIYHCAETMEELANNMEDAIDNAPTVEQKYYERVIAQIKPVIEARPQGEWIEEGTEIGAFGIKYTWNKCNKCGWSSSLVIPKNFCPNCGARMEVKKNEHLDS